MNSRFEYFRMVLSVRLGYSRQSFGAKVLCDWGPTGCLMIDGTTPVPSSVTGKPDMPAELVLRCEADNFDRALHAAEHPGSPDPALNPAAYGITLEGDMALWDRVGPRLLAAAQLAPPEPPYPMTMPALTPAQRLHLEAHGYVVVENAIGAELTGRLVEAVYRLQSEAHAGQAPQGGATLYSNRPDYFRVLQPHLTDKAALDYVVHPRILGMAREATGGARIRYMEADCQIRRPNPLEASTPMISADGLHRGIRANWTLDLHGRARAPFVKMLTNLTDIGPDDGGTVVVPGSHRSPLSVLEIVRALSDDPSMVRRVVAPAGSTLLFFETLVHGSGVIRSGRERLLMISAYGPSFVVPGMQPAAPDSLWEHLDRERYGSLFAPVDGWNWHPDTAAA
jgi:ectoine hydroxylase-related dioxygenase (phytanoyl-CoA dioxygenase family)